MAARVEIQVPGLVELQILAAVAAAAHGLEALGIWAATAAAAS